MIVNYSRQREKGTILYGHYDAGRGSTLSDNLHKHNALLDP